jgi:hypothetical protein
MVSGEPLDRSRWVRGVRGAMRNKPVDVEITQCLHRSTKRN